MPMLDGCLAAMKGLLSSTMGIQISGRRLKRTHTIRTTDNDLDAENRQKGIPVSL